MRKKWLAGALALLISMQGILPCTVFAELDEDGIISIEEEVLPDEELSQAGETMLTEEEDFLETAEEDLEIIEADADLSLEEEGEETEVTFEDFTDAETPEEAADDAELQDLSEDTDAAAAFDDDGITEEAAADPELPDSLEEDEEEADSASDEVWAAMQAALLSVGGGRRADSAEAQNLLGATSSFLSEYSAPDTAAAGEPEMVGVSYLTTQSHSTLKTFLLNNGDYNSETKEYLVGDAVQQDGNTVFWSVGYAPSVNKFYFVVMTQSSDGSLTQILRMEVPYLFSSNPYILFGELDNDTTVSAADLTMTNRTGYNGSQTLNFIVHMAQYSTAAKIRERANTFLSSGYRLWDSLITPLTGITMRDFGFGRSDNGPTISLSATSVTLYVGGSTTINVSNLSYGDGVKSWATSNSGVATVSGGKITGRGTGTATVTVTLKSGLKATVKVTVINSLKPPVLIAAYNGAKGIGIKFHRAANATEYVIYRKYDGAWSKIRTISANSSELQFSGDTIMYTDTTVAKNYGKGYIYSVASKNGSLVSSYDKIGKAIYRLTPPTLTSAVYNGNGTVTVSWKSVFGKTETNGNYDLQVALYKNGKAGTFRSLVTRPGFKYNIVRALVTDCKAGSYVFRIRCSKTNKDRGTFYSEYSPWKSVTVW